MAYQVLKPYQDPSLGIYLYTAPLASLKKFRKTPDAFSHWAVCIQDVCYELRKATKEELKKDKKQKHLYRATRRQLWLDIKRDQERKPELHPEPMGYMYRPYSEETLNTVADRVWKKSLQQKYVFDENNCQVFIRLLVELVGDHETKINFPHSFDKWVKVAGISRDASVLAIAAGGVALAATAATATVDPTPASAAGFAISANLVLTSTTALVASRHRKEKFIEKSQAELREELAPILYS